MPSRALSEEEALKTRRRAQPARGADAARERPTSVARINELQRTMGNQAVARILGTARSPVVQRDWQPGPRGLEWTDAGKVSKFPGRPMMKAPVEKLPDKPPTAPVLAWDAGAKRYAPAGHELEMVTIDLGDATDRQANAGRLANAKEHLDLWRLWAIQFSSESPTFPDLALMAANILEDLESDSGYVLLAYVGPVLWGASTYSVTTADDLGAGLKEEVEAAVGDQPVLYAAYSVAHPWSQYPAERRPHGQFGGAGSAMREMREFAATGFRLPIFAWATNPRSYLQNLKFGFDDVGEPVEGVFPPPEPTAAAQSIPVGAFTASDEK